MLCCIHIHSVMEKIGVESGSIIYIGLWGSEEYAVVYFIESSLQTYENLACDICLWPWKQSKKYYIDVNNLSSQENMDKFAYWIDWKRRDSKDCVKDFEIGSLFSHNVEW